MANLEHVNITVADPKRTAQLLIDLFDWHIRWEGAAMAGAGYTVHVGTDDSYVAVYSGSDPDQTVPKADASYQTRGGLNHIGVVVDDIDAVGGGDDRHLTPISNAVDLGQQRSDNLI